MTCLNLFPSGKSARKVYLSRAIGRDVSRALGQVSYTEKFDHKECLFSHELNRELKQQRQRRLRKRHWKSECAPLQTLSRLYIPSRLIRQMWANYFGVEFWRTVWKFRNRALWHDVTAAILAFQNNEAAATLVFQTNLWELTLFFCKHFLLFQYICIDAGHVSENPLQKKKVVVLCSCPRHNVKLGTLTL